MKKNSGHDPADGRTGIKGHVPQTKADIGEPVLEVEHLSTKDRLQDISLKVHRGEILGIAGLVGAGVQNLSGPCSEPIRALRVRLKSTAVRRISAVREMRLHGRSVWFRRTERSRG